MNDDIEQDEISYAQSTTPRRNATAYVNLSKLRDNNHPMNGTTSDSGVNSGRDNPSNILGHRIMKVAKTNA